MEIKFDASTYRKVWILTPTSWWTRWGKIVSGRQIALVAQYLHGDFSIRSNKNKVYQCLSYPTHHLIWFVTLLFLFCGWNQNLSLWTLRQPRLSELKSHSPVYWPLPHRGCRQDIPTSWATVEIYYNCLSLTAEKFILMWHKKQSRQVKILSSWNLSLYIQ